VLDGNPAPPPQKGAQQPPLFGPCLLWPNVSMDQDGTWYMEVGLGTDHTVLDGDPAPPPQKRGGGAAKRHTPNFRPMSVVTKRLDGSMPLGTEAGLGPCDIVLDGGPSFPKKGHTTHFSTHMYCGQTAEWIKMPLGTKGCLGPGHIVRWGPSSSPPPKKRGGGTALHF